MFRDNRCMDKDMMDQKNYKAGDMAYGYGQMPYPGIECTPIYECPCERVCHREINHMVRHIQPINTRIINHHVYRHSYEPCYTCCEENEVCNVYDQNPCCNK